MNNLYTGERNFQMLISMLKAFEIKNVIASPGTTNVAFVASIQGDPFFKIYSAPDERSAAYMACGFAAEKNEPVVLTCTGATASRNYLSGLTEAFYRKLPIIAVTSAQHPGYIGQLAPQAIDRSSVQNDIAVLSVQIPPISSYEDEWYCNLKLNQALQEIKKGPVHINIVAELCNDFNVKKLPETRIIRRIERDEKYPELDNRKVAVFVGNHLVFSPKLEEAVDRFCEIYNAVVFCDHTSNYHGKYSIQFNLISDQIEFKSQINQIDVLIDIGEVSGAYMSLNPNEVWRIDRNGLIQDRFKKLKYVFNMDEIDFFEHYSKKDYSMTIDYYKKCKALYDSIYKSIPELPFSNIWIAKTMASMLPENCNLHLGILNTLRSWNFFEISKTINCFCNTGGFGIDGPLSTLLGCSIANPQKINYCFLGDLAFFYDMNSLGNHNVGNNIRILLINNGVGVEFRNYNHLAYQFGEAANEFIAAAGHYGKKSRCLVKHYAEDLGFEYLSADGKEAFLQQVDKFVSQERTEKPILFEVFTDEKDESDALKIMNHIIVDVPSVSEIAKSFAKDLLGQKGIDTVKRIIGR